MRLSLVLFTLLCVNMWMGFVHAMNGPVATCCEGWSTTRIHHGKIRNYTIQTEGVCPIRAVKFVTILGKRICSRPEDNWAKRVMEIVDKRIAPLKQGQGGEEETGRTTRGPASSTGNKKRPRRTCRNGRRRFRKGQRKNV
ncbi:C-C motif chemokine 13-like [Myripristis murdjan]|nr:C-C motif chemokine 13-like [Myripristis murdjan]